MPTEVADSETVALIRRFAGVLDQVRPSERAKYAILAQKLTKADICDAICMWIDAKKPVQQIVSTEAEDHVGEPAYVMKPVIRGKRFYVKVTFETDPRTGVRLLIISAHL